MFSKVDTYFFQFYNTRSNSLVVKILFDLENTSRSKFIGQQIRPEKFLIGRYIAQILDTREYRFQFIQSKDSNNLLRCRYEYLSVLENEYTLHLLPGRHIRSNKRKAKSNDRQQRSLFATQRKRELPINQHRCHRQKLHNFLLQ